MRDHLPPGWATYLAIEEMSGSLVEDRGDHLVVRTPANPQYHWGNCVLVTDPAAVDDADRWVGAFQVAFPGAAWVAIGLVRPPDDERAWTGRGLALEVEEALTTCTLPRAAPLPDGYTARELAGDDWERSVAFAVEENDRLRQEHPATYEPFVRNQVAARRGLAERGAAAFFGAFAGDDLVAELGIVRCGTTARYQSVMTHVDHRGRGLASHLLGVAARWAGDRGCDRWVIVTEATNPAGRVYRTAGFEPDVGSAQAYRRPPL